jgi:hypothetical protein
MNKLKNFGPVYYINLEDDVDRRNNIETQFNHYGIEFTRISAFDGRNDDLSEFIYGAYPGYDMSSTEVGASCSHLYCLKNWLDTCDSEYAIICEDDLDLTLCEYWNFTWGDFMKNLPEEWDCIQLAIINNHPSHIIMQLHHRQWWDWSAACYLISRNFAQRLVNQYCRGNKFALSLYPEKAVADSIVYLDAKTYSINLFSYRTDFYSNIHQLHVEHSHVSSREYVWNWWKEIGKNLSIEELVKL